MRVMGAVGGGVMVATGTKTDVGKTSMIGWRTKMEWLVYGSTVSVGEFCFDGDNLDPIHFYRPASRGWTLQLLVTGE